MVSREANETRVTDNYLKKHLCEKTAISRKVKTPQKHGFPFAMNRKIHKFYDLKLKMNSKRDILDVVSRHLVQSRNKSPPVEK